MRLAIITIHLFLEQFWAADEEEQKRIAHEFVSMELPIVLEQMIEAQHKLDGER